ncbi:MAG: DUF1501 domain-containing protein [Planctomycetia bacterium]|nr:DUF1501 domain-containing protein [Planctomycetia bacterium]
MKLEHHTHVAVNRHGVIGRRDFLRAASLAGSLGAISASGVLPWADLVRANAPELRRRGMACILLFMQGGPSQFETFSPKPGHANGGETKAIQTSVSGIEIAENLPNLAKVMDDVAVVRSMTSKEGSHPRAQSLLHTGYLPTASVKYPTLGSLVAKERRDEACELPSFVLVGGGRALGVPGAGLLGVDYEPFVVAQAGTMPQNSQPTTSQDRYKRRLGLLEKLEAQYAAEGAGQVVEDHQKLYGKAAKMILSPQMKAFDLAEEPGSARDAYGRSPFGSACLLARRLVDTGVTFVEILAGNWDTHDDNFNRTKTLCGTIDQPMAQLISDLKARGMLDSTLIVWMGEFGRTPRINPRSGRDHYPRAFNVALAGGGIQGGQVIGKTDDGGSDVKDRPVTVNDLFQTICHSLKIDPKKENMSSIGLPIKIVDGGQPVSELFG